ncbi:alpha/beta hydrolase [Treponema primitia]|uniref:alpha/beta hydrolase n=1 Tax=Treponema primitia TaxID=88058 RepID=UPI00025551C4|nr:alpha/beta hydrolase [Treponema primitia]
MKKTLNLTAKEPLITLADGIVYAQRPDWCDATTRSLKISLLRKRQFADYDERVTWPVIIWLCGGAWTEMDRNVWTPELVWFAKKGFVIASVDYSVTARTRFPQQIVDIKEAIRFLRAHADKFRIDPNHFAVMGESAGGYLAALTGAAGTLREYDQGAYLDQSSAVQAAIPWYPATEISSFPIADILADALPPDMRKYPDITKLVTKDTPPYLLLHGTADSQVPLSQSEKLYDVLQAAGVEADLIILEGSEHAEATFVQPEVKEIILEFLRKHLK